MNKIKYFILIIFLIFFSSFEVLGLSTKSQISFLPIIYSNINNENRDLMTLDSTYGYLPAEICYKSKTQKQNVLLLGVGRGVAALELALTAPNVSITGVNKERNLFDINYLMNYFQNVRHIKYSKGEIDKALSRIQIKICDIEDNVERKKYLGDTKFDYVIFETNVIQYIKDKIRVIEAIFNEYVDEKGTYAFQGHYLVEENNFQTSKKIYDTILNSFKKVADERSKTEITPSEKYNKGNKGFIEGRYFTFKKKIKAKLFIPFVLNENKTFLDDEKNKLRYYHSVYVRLPGILTVIPSYFKTLYIRKYIQSGS
ncbi:MAG: hypothetical protein ACD_79C01433G0002 [uncultured bacterium]|nr:MAG: hypothetical protein ACD_79C01433G0002 [uncultured bacterium]